GKNDPVKWAKGSRPVLVQASGGWRLTIAERKRILLDNIYGVDIDAQAVEVTKLSLLLKVLEGETEQSLSRQMRLLHERVLPDLGSNIKCGNSLIGPDFYDDAKASKLGDEELNRINVFDWEKEFPTIMKDGGFDAVIGNPPYLRIQGLQEYYGNQIDYFIKHYQSAVKRFDLYLLFTEKGFSLLKEDGFLGFICPHKFLNSDFGSGLREFLVKNYALETFISFGNNLIFSQASTYTGILLLKKSRKECFSYYEFPTLLPPEMPLGLAALDKKDFAEYKYQSLSSEPWTLTLSSTQGLIEKLRQQTFTVGDVFESVFQGIVTGIDEIYLLAPISENGKIIECFSQREEGNIKIEKGILKPLLKGEDVSRYTETSFKYYCIYPYKLVEGKTVILQEDELASEYPLAYRYLKQYKNELKDLRVKYKTNPKYWYSCHRARSIAAFERERIIAAEISLGCNMTLDTNNLYHNTTVYSLLPSLSLQEKNQYWLGLLNSIVMWWFLANTGNVLRGGYFRFKTHYLNPFPLRRINFSDSTDRVRHNSMVELVERMLDLHKQLASARTDQDRTMLQRRIDATDKQIDALVYDLYALTEEEIRIVEAATQ
ncbi:MAG TPA: TaqI-like C-terminal specificity domain-containing protein, partial [Pyrinomonadaceae bacterium]|nr:TaqI-like C-terminal specificity domain-containing protein [Pyrinomonadaceae bacterium]